MEILRGTDPLTLFQEWLAEAAKTEPNDPEAMALATVSADGQPSVRIVLLKGVGADGFRFFTNLESRKSGELLHNHKAALCLHWKSLRRQIRVEGTVGQLPHDVAEAYFQTRHPLSRLGAWASRQSRPLESRAALEAKVDEFRAKFGEENIPCPPHWGGFLLSPAKIEFWQDGQGRLHDRFLFAKTASGWDIQRLHP